MDRPAPGDSSAVAIHGDIVFVPEIVDVHLKADILGRFVSEHRLLDAVSRHGSLVIGIAKLFVADLHTRAEGEVIGQLVCRPETGRLIGREGELVACS